jgi:primosomal protein N'
VRVAVSGPDPDAPVAALRELKAGLESALAGEEVLGPAPLLRLRGRYRAQLVAKAKSPRRVAGAAGRLLAAAAPAMRRDGLAASVDVDPQASS